ncbi:MAG: ketoacyl-ACP synthase III [Patescibacteria group bacterium]
MQGVRIAGMGSVLPDWCVTNDGLVQLLVDERERLRVQGIVVPADQEKEFETSDDWIRERTGVQQRYFCPPDNSVATSDLAVQAAHDAWTDAYGEAAGIFPEFIIVATVSPDHNTTPPTSVIVHRKMSVPKALKLMGAHNDDQEKIWPCFLADVTLACTSFMVALEYGCMLVETGRCTRGLVIGADRMSSVMSRHRRSPFIILGDGASAFALEATHPEVSQFRPQECLGAGDGGPSGMYEKLIVNQAGGSAQPLQPGDTDPLVDAHLMRMDGKKVFEIVSPLVPKTIIPAILEKAGLTLADINVIILHQANQRITDNIAKSLQKEHPEVEVRVVTLANLEGASPFATPNGKPIVWVFCNIERYGNMTSASVPTAFHEARDAGLIRAGAVVLVAAYGGGLSWAARIVRM